METEDRRRAKEERRASQAQLGGGFEVEGEEGEVVVPEGEDGDGDEDGDEILEQPPPQPPVLPLPE